LSQLHISDSGIARGLGKTGERIKGGYRIEQKWGKIVGTKGKMKKTEEKESKKMKIL